MSSQLRELNKLSNKIRFERREHLIVIITADREVHLTIENAKQMIGILDMFIQEIDRPGVDKFDVKCEGCK